MANIVNLKGVGKGQDASHPTGIKKVGSGQARPASKPNPFGHGNPAFEKSRFDKDKKEAPEGSATDKKSDKAGFKAFQKAGKK